MQRNPTNKIYAQSEITGVCDVFFMFANTRLYATSQRHDVTSTLFAIIYAQIVDFWKQAL